MHDIDTLNSLFGDAVRVKDGRVTVVRPEVLATAKMDELVRTAVFGEPHAREYARWLIWEVGQAAGVRPSSIHVHCRSSELTIMGKKLWPTSWAAASAMFFGEHWAGIGLRAR